MSAPRPVIPGKTYLLSRRCFNRQFLLRPSPRVNQIFKFCLAVAATRTGVQLHAYCVLSNHYHLLVTDPEGKTPEFMHWLNEYVAKCVNAELGRWESFWAPGSYSSVTLTDYEDLMGKLVYVFTNPVEAGLVRTLHQWPGAHSLPEQMEGHSEVVDRPVGFFREDGPVPKSATLKLAPPPACTEWGAGYLDDLTSRVAEREAELQAKARKEKRPFLGPKRVLAQSPFGRPKDAEPRRELNPRVAARDKWRRVEVLGRLKEFLADYREAWKRFAKGERSVRFPHGTYWMRVRLGVVCAEP